MSIKYTLFLFLVLSMKLMKKWFGRVWKLCEDLEFWVRGNTHQSIVAVNFTACVTTQATHTEWCSEIGSLASLDGLELHAFSNVREHCTRLYLVTQSTLLPRQFDSPCQSIPQRAGPHTSSTCSFSFELFFSSLITTSSWRKQKKSMKKRRDAQPNCNSVSHPQCCFLSKENYSQTKKGIVKTNRFKFAKTIIDVLLISKAMSSEAQGHITHLQLGMQCLIIHQWQ